MLKLESIEKVYKIDFCTSYGVEQEIEDTKEMILEECRQYLGQDYTDVIFASATNTRNDGIVELHTKICAFDMRTFYEYSKISVSTLMDNMMSDFKDYDRKQCERLYIEY